MRASLVPLGAALLIGLAACGSGSGQNPSPDPHARTAVGVKVDQSSLGSILTDQDGRTLYAFFNDKNGTSSCADQCVATWPALVSRQAVAADAGIDHKLLSQTTRAEGTVQATYGNWPLYYYVGDQGPGDIDGQGVDGVWFVVGRDGKLIKTTP